MWLYDEGGRFYSAVQHNDDDGLLVVRTRVRADAEHLVAVARESGTLAEVIAYQRSDYPFRVILPVQAWATFAAAVAYRVTYGNYKAHVEATADHAEVRHDALHKVWAANLCLEQIDRPDARWDEDWDDEDDPWQMERESWLAAPFGAHDGPLTDLVVQEDGSLTGLGFLPSEDEDARVVREAEAETWGDQ